MTDIPGTTSLNPDFDLIVSPKVTTTSENMGSRSTVAWALAADAGPGVSTLPITDEFRSQTEDFDWKTIPETATCIIHPANELTGITTYSYSSPSGKALLKVPSYSSDFDTQGKALFLPMRASGTTTSAGRADIHP